MTRSALWGGRFAAPPADVLKRLNDSFAVDREMLPEDVEGSLAWARALGRAGVLSTSEVKRLSAALRRVEPPVELDHEDVHSYVEARLKETLGSLGGKLHTGRSRNDQVATDLRLWLKKALAEAHAHVLDLAEALARRAVDEAATAMPGYTHLKRAEPVTFGHWALAYVEMLLRDADRIATSLERADECPLGSGALSGTPLPVDRVALARDLGFSRPTANSLDAVSDRDAAADYLYASALLLSHLSRLAEDLIAYSSDEFAFVELPDALATGSSRMPHKKNPDLLELTRGHAGRALGELTGLLAVLKGLPLAYDKDLQLDKEPLFRNRAVVGTVLPALTSLVTGLILHRDRMAAAAGDDRLLATELADALAARGIPFREAHELVGKRISAAAAAGKGLRELGPGDGITPQDLSRMTVDKALRKRTALGGTSPLRVKSAAPAALARIQKARRG